MRGLPFALLALPAMTAMTASLPAHAQMFKCTDGGKVTYSEAPCPRGAQTVMPPPDAPVVHHEPAELKRMQEISAGLQREREAREAQQARADALHDRQAAQRRETCAKLERERQWADEDVRRATHHTIDAARLKARRAAERLAACR